MNPKLGYLGAILMLILLSLAIAVIAMTNTELNDPAVFAPAEINDLVEEQTEEERITIEDILLAETEENPSVAWTWDDDFWFVEGDGLPNHATGEFPNSGNPNTISAQDVNYTIPRNPVKLSTPTNSPTAGVTIGGVKMEPGTAERDELTGWAIEAFQSLLDLGLDAQNAHVQPTGAYHYHGIPDVLAGNDDEAHSPLIGFASDGFPIYARYGYEDPSEPESAIVEFDSSYLLKVGPRGANEPSGNYDGTYTNDFEFIQNSGDLDECNGRFTVTPEYPDGTYAYFMTESFPYIHRCVYGDVHESFERGPEDGLPPGAGGPPPRP